MLRCGRIAAMALVASVVCLTGESASAGPFDRLLPFIPSDTNMLVFMAPGKVRGSAFAKGELADKYRAAAQAIGSSLNSPIVEKSLVASHFDFTAHKPNWTVAVADTNATVAPDKLGAQHGGKPDTIGGVAASVLPGDAILLKFESELFGAVSPADRQFATRWIRNSKANRHVPPSGYLERAVGYANDVGSELVVAFDLEGVLSASELREQLPKSKAFKDSGLPLDSAVAALVTLQGSTLAVLFTDKAHAGLRFDFGVDVSMFGKSARALALEGLNSFGVVLDDVAKWEVEAKGKSIILSGELSPRGLRQVLSFVEAPLEFEDDTAAKDGDKSGDPIVYNTMQNLKTIDILLTDARNPDPNKTGTLTSGAYAQWLDRYAKKLNRLPIVNVDDDAVNYATTAAHQLRSMAVGYRGVGIKASVYSANPNISYSYSPATWFGGYYTTTNAGLSDRLLAKRQELSTVSLSAVEMWQVMEDAAAQLRVALSKRYKVDF